MHGMRFWRAMRCRGRVPRCAAVSTAGAALATPGRPFMTAPCPPSLPTIRPRTRRPGSPPVSRTPVRPVPRASPTTRCFARSSATLFMLPRCWKTPCSPSNSSSAKRNSRKASRRASRRASRKASKGPARALAGPAHRAFRLAPRSRHPARRPGQPPGSQTLGPPHPHGSLPRRRLCLLVTAHAAQRTLRARAWRKRSTLTAPGQSSVSEPTRVTTSAASGSRRNSAASSLMFL